VSDVSTDGAKIFVSGEAAVPTHFELAFDNAGTRRLCELVWWRGKTAGVKFCSVESRKRGVDIWPDFNRNKQPVRPMAYR
jgi:hypothetical protein